MLTFILIFTNVYTASIMNRRSHKIINFGREPDLRIFSEENESLVKDLAKRLLEEMTEIAATASKEIFQGEENLWEKSLEIQIEKIQDMNLTPSAKLLERLDRENLSHEELGMKIAEENAKFFQNYSNSRESIFNKEASSSIERQKQLESKKGPPFEEYLREFLNKVS